MSLFATTLRVNDKRFQQQMDLGTDTAFYRKLNNDLLMSIDSSGNCKDAEGNPCGKFSMRWPAGTWYYEAEDGSLIETNQKMLFDKAEPEVIAQLFATVL
jgi:hypothetical protein